MKEKIKKCFRLFKKFIRTNIGLTILFLLAILIIVFYIYTFYNKDVFKNVTIWINLLFEISIGYIISFVFYLLQVYIPFEKNLSIVSKEIKKDIHFITNQIDSFIKYFFNCTNTQVDEKNLKEEDFQAALHKLDLSLTINKIDINTNKYFTIGQEIVYTARFVEYYTEIIFKMYSNYLTAEIISVLNEIITSLFHMSLARVIVNIKNIKFGDKYKDNFIYKYYLLNEKLKKLINSF